MTATQPQLEAVLAAAGDLLDMRKVQMDTIEEWANLARAVAAATGSKTSDLLTDRDLEQVAAYPPLPWDEAVDGPLPPVKEG